MGGAKEQTKCHSGGGDDETEGGSGTHTWEYHMLALSGRVLIWGDMGFGWRRVLYRGDDRLRGWAARVSHGQPTSRGNPSLAVCG